MKIDEVCIGKLNGVPVILNPDFTGLPNDLPHDKLVDLLVMAVERFGADNDYVECVKARIVRRMQHRHASLN